MQSLARFLLWSGSLAVATCACQGRSYSAPEPPAQPVASPAPSAYLGDTLPDPKDQGLAQNGGNLVVAADQEPASVNYQLDPSDTWARRIGGLIFDSLAQPDPNSWQPEAHLAERWEIDADGRTLTFHLRPGVLWDDGVPFTADDVLFTFTVLRDPKSKAAAARALLAPLESVAKIDEHTVRFRFAKRYAFAFSAISETAIYPRHLFAGGDFNNHPANRAPAGTGPFRLVRWVAGERIVLARNPRYWGKPPALQQITFRILPLPEKRLQLLKRGEVDVIERLTPQLWDSAVQDPQVASQFWRLRHVPSSLQGLGYNERRPFFATSTLRRALTMLLDRGAMLRDLRMGVDTAAASWFYPGAREFSADLTPWPYDPAQAMRTLEAADWVDHDGDGVRDNHGVAMAFTLVYPAGNGLHRDVAVRVRDALAAAQIRVIPQSLPWVEYLDKLQEGDFDACMSVWTLMPHSDPYSVWHSGSGSDAGFNFVGFADPEADSLLEQARELADDGRRVAMYQHLNAILHREEPYTLLFHRYHLSLVNRRFGGIVSSPFGVLRYERFYVRDTAHTVATP